MRMLKSRQNMLVFAVALGCVLTLPFTSAAPEATKYSDTVQGPAPQTADLGENIHFIPLSMFILMDLASVSSMDSVHLVTDDNKKFYAKVEWVVQGSCEVPQSCLETTACCPHTESCYANVGLTGGWQLNLTLDHLILLDPDKIEVLNSEVKRNCHAGSAEGSEEASSTKVEESATKESEPRELLVAGCHSSGCGAVRVSPYSQSRGSICTYRTGIYGGRDACNTPAVIASNFFDPVSMSLLRYQPGLVFGNGASFAQQNGWL